MLTHDSLGYRRFQDSYLAMLCSTCGSVVKECANFCAGCGKGKFFLSTVFAFASVLDSGKSLLQLARGLGYECSLIHNV